MDRARVGSTCRRLRRSGLSLSAPVLFFLSDSASYPPVLYHILVLMATRQSSRHSRPTNQSVSSNASASSSRSERASSRPQQNVSTPTFPSMYTAAIRDCSCSCTPSIHINHLPWVGISISSPSEHVPPGQLAECTFPSQRAAWPPFATLSILLHLQLVVPRTRPPSRCYRLVLRHPQSLDTLRWMSFHSHPMS